MYQLFQEEDPANNAARSTTLEAMLEMLTQIQQRQDQLQQQVSELQQRDDEDSISKEDVD